MAREFTVGGIIGLAVAGDVAIARIEVTKFKGEFFDEMEAFGKFQQKLGRTFSFHGHAVSYTFCHIAGFTAGNPRQTARQTGQASRDKKHPDKFLFYRHF